MIARATHLALLALMIITVVGACVGENSGQRGYATGPGRVGANSGQAGSASGPGGVGINNGQVTNNFDTPFHGYLQPGNDTMPDSRCEPNEDGPALLLGSTMFNASREVSDTLPFIRLGDLPLLSIKKGPSGLVIKADIRDRDGNVVAEIEDENQFYLVGKRIAFPKRPDPSTLEVIGDKNEPILYIRYANPGLVVVRGTFFSPRAQQVIATDKTILATNDTTFFGLGFGGRVLVAGGCITVRKNNRGGIDQNLNGATVVLLPLQPGDPPPNGVLVPR